MFVFSTTLLCIYVFAFCWVYIRKIMEGEHTTIWKAMIKTPASIVLIVYTFISMWFVGGLTAFHLYLISTNQVRDPHHLHVTTLYRRIIWACIKINSVLVTVQVSIYLCCFCRLLMKISDIDMIGELIRITKEWWKTSKKYFAPAFPPPRTISGQRCQGNPGYLLGQWVGVL